MNRFIPAAPRRRHGLATRLAMLTALPALAAFASPAAALVTNLDYAGGPLTIPDNSTQGISVTLVASGVDGILTDVNCSFSSSGACSTNTASSSVGIGHPYVGDLSAVLVSPSGAQVVLFAASGGGANFGRNLCNTVFDDEGGGISFQNASPLSEPFSGTWLPNQPLAAFKGGPPNGVWTLRIRDLAAPDTGRFLHFRLTLTTEPPTPSPTPTVSLTPSISATETPSLTPSPTQSPSPTESFTPSATPTESPIPTESLTPSVTPTESPVPTESATETPSLTPSETPTPSPTETASVTPTETPSLTPTETPSLTPSETPSFTPTETPSFTPSETPTPSPTDSPTLTPSETPSFTPTATPTATASPTTSATPTASPTPASISALILDFLLGRQSDPAGLETNGDGAVDVADLIRAGIDASAPN